MACPQPAGMTMYFTFYDFIISAGIKFKRMTLVFLSYSLSNLLLCHSIIKTHSYIYQYIGVMGLVIHLS